MLQKINIYAGFTDEQIKQATPKVHYKVSGKISIVNEFKNNFADTDGLSIWIEHDNMDDYLLAADLAAALWCKFHNSNMITDIPGGPDNHFMWFGNLYLVNTGGDNSPRNRLYRYCNWVANQPFIPSPSYQKMIDDGIIETAGEKKEIVDDTDSKISDLIFKLAEAFKKAGM